MRPTHPPADAAARSRREILANCPDSTERNTDRGRDAYYYAPPGEVAGLV